jgi:hypothetical protein
MKPDRLDSLTNDAEIILAVRTGNVSRLNRRLARLAEDQTPENLPSSVAQSSPASHRSRLSRDQDR